MHNTYFGWFKIIINNNYYWILIRPTNLYDKNIYVKTKHKIMLGIILTASVAII